MEKHEQEELMEELYLKGKTYKEIGEELGISEEAARGRIRNRDYYSPRSNNEKLQEAVKQLSFYPSEELDSELTDDIKRKLMQEAGIDDEDWDISQARISTWDMPGREEPGKSIKLTVRPKTIDEKIRFEEIAEDIAKIEPLNFKNKKVKDGKTDLVIPLYDLHFGNSTLKDYEDYLENILIKISAKSYDNIVVLAGGDLLNEDNYNGTTASGTPIGKTNMHKAWIEAFTFLRDIITKSLENSKKVQVVYVPGNHDTFSGHTVMMALEQYFSNTDVKFNIDQKVFKAFMLGNIFIGCTHGHKSRIKKYPSIMATAYPKEWGKAKIRECFTGHLHTEWTSKDEAGVVIRQMPTSNKPDQWHEDNGFIGAHRRNFIMEYDKNDIIAIHIV